MLNSRLPPKACHQRHFSSRLHLFLFILLINVFQTFSEMFGSSKENNFENIFKKDSFKFSHLSLSCQEHFSCTFVFSYLLTAPGDLFWRPSLARFKICSCDHVHFICLSVLCLAKSTCNHIAGWRTGECSVQRFSVTSSGTYIRVD